MYRGVMGNLCPNMFVQSPKNEGRREKNLIAAKAKENFLLRMVYCLKCVNLVAKIIIWCCTNKSRREIVNDIVRTKERLHCVLGSENESRCDYVSDVVRTKEKFSL